MTPVKSALAGLAAGLIAYVFAANVGGVFSGGDSSANLADTIGEVVTESLAPGAKQVTGGAKQSGTKLAPSGTTVSPKPSQSVTMLAPVTPRAIAAVSATPTPTVATSRTPTPSPVVPRFNTPTPTPTPSPTLSPSPSTTPTTSTTPTPDPTQTSVPTPAGTSHVVINEIAWSGTATSSADEWIELYNSGTGPQELEGWSLCDAGGAIVTFSSEHRIQRDEFFLIERGDDDNAISDIQADYAHSFGSSGLLNTGELLSLKAGTCAEGIVIDEVGPGAWYAGSGSPGFASMERISAAGAGSDASNWATWGTIPDSQGNTVSTGQDAAGNPIRGTPKYANSVSQ